LERIEHFDHVLAEMRLRAADLTAKLIESDSPETRGRIKELQYWIGLPANLERQLKDAVGSDLTNH
jgi:hypothetical protein